MAKKEKVVVGESSVTATLPPSPTTHPDFSPVLLTFDLWARLYRDHLKLKPQVIKWLEKHWQDPPAGYWRLPILQGLTQNGLVTAMRKMKIDFFLYANDLDTAIPHHDRDPRSGSYSILVRARKEADVELKGLSADQLKDRGLSVITSPERLAQELAYFQATDGAATLEERHLDVTNVSLCAGSRYSDGGVPGVSWRCGGRRVGVYWYGPDCRLDGLRARVAVGSLAP